MKSMFVLVGCLIVFCAFAQADYVKVETLELDADGLKMLDIDCGAGFLEIEGDPDLDMIKVEAEIIIENIDDDEAEEFVDEYMRLDLDRQGKRGKLTSTFEQGNILSKIFKRSSARINLTIKMPADMRLKIEDGSGDIDIRTITQDVIIDDGSGEMSVVDVGGDVDIEDGSGEITLELIGGDVKIDDGSGEIDAIDIDGDIDVDDGSGDIVIRRVAGDVTVDDGSGDIRIDDVREDVRILDEGSGDCKITNVDGRVRRR